MRWGLASALVTFGLGVAAPAYAYPPPPLDCPDGTRGAIGGYCVPDRCDSDADCGCDGLRGVEWVRCWALCGCGPVDMCVEHVPIEEAGPYPTTYRTDRCRPGAAPTECECGPRRVCRDSPARIVAWVGVLVVLPLVAVAIAAVVWRRRRRGAP